MCRLPPKDTERTFGGTRSQNTCPLGSRRLQEGDDGLQAALVHLVGLRLPVPGLGGDVGGSSERQEGEEQGTYSESCKQNSSCQVRTMVLVFICINFIRYFVQDMAVNKDIVDDS